MDKMWAIYSKSCKQLEVPRNKVLEEQHKEEYIDNGKMISKVSKYLSDAF